MRAEDHRRAIRHLVELLDEYRADGAQPIHHVLVVDHFMPHVDRRAEQIDRPLDDIDRPIDTGTKPARIGQENLHGLRLYLGGLRFEQRIQQQERRPHGDGRIGHVECREIRPIPVKVDEIDDMPEADAIDDVAERSAEHQCKARRQQAGAPRAAGGTATR